MISPVGEPMIVTSPQGWRMHPILGVEKYHSGVDLGVDYGAPIYAAQSGTVTTAGWLNGYGYAVIIDHGGGLTSLYGHNQSLLVTAWQLLCGYVACLRSQRAVRACCCWELVPWGYCCFGGLSPKQSILV